MYAGIIANYYYVICANQKKNVEQIQNYNCSDLRFSGGALIYQLFCEN